MPALRLPGDGQRGLFELTPCPALLEGGELARLPPMSRLDWMGIGPSARDAPSGLDGSLFCRNCLAFLADPGYTEAFT